eukprot:4508185-Amphidinium_carterae.1
MTDNDEPEDRVEQLRSINMPCCGTTIEDCHRSVAGDADGPVGTRSGCVDVVGGWNCGCCIGVDVVPM